MGAKSNIDFLKLATVKILALQLSSVSDKKFTSNRPDAPVAALLDGVSTKMKK